MNPKHTINRIIAVLCIVLVLCYPLGTILSHDHECTGNNCIICSLLDASKSVFAAMAVCVSFVKPAEYIYNNAAFNDRGIYLKDGTLVLKKVKLSD